MLHHDFIGDELRLLRTSPPRGIVVRALVGDQADTRRTVADLASCGAPLAVFGEEEFGCDRVVFDHEAGAYQLTRWLIGQGRRRPLFLQPATINRLWLSRRYAGYARAMAEAGLRAWAPLVEAPAFEWSEKRQISLARQTPLHLRIVNRLEHVEVYVNDELRLAFSRYRGLGGQVGSWVDRGEARFGGLRLRALGVTRPS